MRRENCVLHQHKRNCNLVRPNPYNFFHASMLPLCTKQVSSHFPMQSYNMGKANLPERETTLGENNVMGMPIIFSFLFQLPSKKVVSVL